MLNCEWLITSMRRDVYIAEYERNQVSGGPMDYKYVSTNAH